MLQAHVNINAAKLESARRPLPRELKKSRMGDGAAFISATGSSRGERSGETPCSCSMLITQARGMIFVAVRQRDCIRRNSF